MKSEAWDRIYSFIIIFMIITIAITLSCMAWFTDFPILIRIILAVLGVGMAYTLKLIPGRK